MCICVCVVLFAKSSTRYFSIYGIFHANDHWPIGWKAMRIREIERFQYCWSFAQNEIHIRTFRGHSIFNYEITSAEYKSFLIHEIQTQHVCLYVHVCVCFSDSVNNIRQIIGFWLTTDIADRTQYNGCTLYSTNLDVVFHEYWTFHKRDKLVLPTPILPYPTMCVLMFERVLRFGRQFVHFDRYKSRFSSFFFPLERAKNKRKAYISWHLQSNFRTK